MNSTLFEYFAVSSNSIEPKSDSIPEEAFRSAALEYIDLVNEYKIKLGDILCAFRKQYPGLVQDFLISYIAAHTEEKKATLDMKMSLSANAPKPKERILSSTHYAEIQSLKNEKEKKRLINWAISEKAKGRKVPTQVWKKEVRDAKIRSGQDPMPKGNAAKRKKG